MYILDISLHKHVNSQADTPASILKLVRGVYVSLIYSEVVAVFDVLLALAQALALASLIQQSPTLCFKTLGFF